ncbi:MAG: hypothetical protein Q9213_007089 [Squamulea squamosa]
MADTNYFVCTLGQAVKVNEESPHQFGTINEFLDYQAHVVPKSPAVGFPIPSQDDNQEWGYEIFTRESAEAADHRFSTVSIPEHLLQSIVHNDSTHLTTNNGGPLDPEYQEPIASDIAFLFHTSGTSSGLPKPIPQSHHGAVGVLPCLPQDHEKATFTTTPLYHGGISDCFRAWTSGALIWLFPGKDVPITPSNILKSLDCTRRAEASSEEILATPVKYFSSVPYILQMVSAESNGMKMLQSMDIVGVGGAALPQDVGDSLVHEGVNLVSRFGSAECGFLLSSHRDYQTDKEWQYLRSHGLDLLVFEEQQDGSGLFELIIRPNWPHMAKRNREDGSFATADLFAPHPSIKNAWKYHSRADSQLTLITGKKFDPAPPEAAIASHELLSDALIFGNGMQSAGALLFRSEKSLTMDKDRLLDDVWPAINDLNKEGQAHTRLSRSMLIVMNAEAPGLEKSSKGSVLRAQAERMYEEDIRGAYDQKIAESEDPFRDFVPEHEIPKAVLEIIKTVLESSDSIPEDADLFSYGVDSVACMAIRAKLQSRILDPKAQALPLNVVYDCGNIKRLSGYLTDIRKGRMTESEDEIQLMKDLAVQYSNPFQPSTMSSQSNGTVCATEAKDDEDGEHLGERVLLTGATGALGAHILHILRSSPSVSQITCLVRASSPLAAHERVSRSLVARGKPGLPAFSSTPAPTVASSAAQDDSSTATPTVTCLPCTLSHPTLGISPGTYAHLAKTTTLIIHAAWAVNFTARLRSFEKDHIAGLSHLLRLSLAAPQRAEPIRFLFLSSTASVTNTPTSKYPIAERVSSNPDDASPLGYSRSKWVAENICDAFHTRIARTDHQAGSGNYIPRIAILRIGQLTSDTSAGIWNMSEAWPLMLSTAPVLHALPDLKRQALDWLPVDSAAQAVLDVAAAMKDDGTGADDRCPVFHILNRYSTPTWSDLLDCIKKQSPALELEILPPREWLQKLEGCEGKLPAKKLVGLWKGGFAEGDEGKDEQHVRFDLERSKEVSATMREVKPLGEEFLGRMWRWIEGQTMQ